MNDTSASAWRRGCHAFANLVSNIFCWASRPQVGWAKAYFFGMADHYPQDRSISAYIELANKSLEKKELAWPSRPKFHVPRFFFLNRYHMSMVHLVRGVQHLNILLVIWIWYP